MLHLRDMVVALEWLARRPVLDGLSPAQTGRLAALLPSIHANLYGPPGRIDAALERRVWRLLRPEQARAAQAWLVRQKTAPDFMATLQALERRIPAVDPLP